MSLDRQPRLWFLASGIQLTATIGLFFVVSAAAADTIRVGLTNDDDYAHPAAALAAARDGDVILVAAGEYLLEAPLDFLGKRVTLRGEAGRDETVLRWLPSAQGERASALLFETGETSETVIEALTITGGLGSGFCGACVRRGGAVWCVRASPTFRDVRFTGNRADAGGAVFVGEAASPLFVDCVLEENEALVGGAVYCSDGASPRFEGTALRRNRAASGGGVHASDGSTPEFVNAFIVGNEAEEGGGVSIEGSTPTFSRSIVRANVADYGGGVIVEAEAAPVFEDCRITGNTARRSGAGIFCETSTLTLNNVIVAWNGSPGAAGLYAVHARVSIMNSTIARNRASPSEEWGTIDGSAIVLDELRSGSLIDHSILWGNDGSTSWSVDQQSPSGTTVRFSCMESAPQQGVGNLALDPEFCGWTLDELWVDSSAPLGGDGTMDSPFPDIAAAFETFSLVLGPQSPCRGAGEGGGDIGARPDEVRDACVEQDHLKIYLGPGEYPVDGFSLSDRVSIEGAGWEATTLTGLVRGLTSNAVLAGVTVTGGQLGGVWLEESDATLRACRILRNRGPGVFIQGGRPTIESCVIAENGPTQSGYQWSSGNGVSYGSRAHVRIISSTIANNAGFGVSSGEFLSSVTISKSILWGNGFGSVEARESTVTTSCVEGTASTPPGFCGFDDAELPEVGDQEDLDRALAESTFDYSLDNDSIWLVRGAGAPTGSCESPGIDRLTFLLGPGTFRFDRNIQNVTIMGRSRDETVLTGAMRIAANSIVEGVSFEASVTIDGRAAELDGVSLRQELIFGNESNGARVHDALILGGVTVHNRATVELDRVTIVGATGPGIEFWSGANLTLSNSIIWRNAGGSFRRINGGEFPTITYSCIEGRDVWPGIGNQTYDPRFCGSSDAGSIDVETSMELSRALEFGADFDYALAADSPCLTGGEDESRMGATSEICDRAGTSRRRIRLAAREYELPANAILNWVDIEGASREATILRSPTVSLGNSSSLAYITFRGELVFSSGAALVDNVDVRAFVPGGESSVQCREDTEPTLRGSVLVGRLNTEYRARPLIERSTIVDSGSDGIRASHETVVTVDHSIIWGHQGAGILVENESARVNVRGSCVEEFWPGAGNFTADPLFCLPDVSEDELEVGPDDDLREHLASAELPYSLFVESPCVDGGVEGERIGADRGQCESLDDASRVIVLTPGTYRLTRLPPLRRTILRGSSATEVHIEGYLPAFDAGSSLENVTVTSASLSVLDGAIDVSILSVAFRNASSNAIVVGERSLVRIEETSIVGSGGAAIMIGDESDVEIIHSTIHRNEDGIGFISADSVDATTRVVIESSIVWGNTRGAIHVPANGSGIFDVRYSCIEGESLPGEGNVDADPLFCGFEAGSLRIEDPEQWEQLDPVYRLSLSMLSPCRDAALDGRDMGPITKADDCASPGSQQLTVDLVAGIFPASVISRLPRPVSIRGAGLEDTILDGSIELRTGIDITDLTIDGSVTVRSGQTVNLEQVMIRNGRVDVDLRSSFTLRDSVVDGGGGIRWGEIRSTGSPDVGSSAGIRLINSTIRACSGNGIEIRGCSEDDDCNPAATILIDGCRVVENQGLGTRITHADPRIIRTFIADNLGGGISCYDASPRIDYSTIVGNGGRNAGGIDRRTGAGSAPTVTRSVIWGNGGDPIRPGRMLHDTYPTVTNSIIEGGWSGGGNSGADPLFIGWGQTNEVWIGDPTAGEGDGSRENPFASILQAVKPGRFRYAVAPGSPLLTADGATRVGSGAEVDDGPRSSRLLVHFDEGLYEIGGIANLANHVSIIGAGAESTTLTSGRLIALRGGERVEGVSVVRATVEVGGGDDPEIYRCDFRDCGEAVRNHPNGRVILRSCRFYRNGSGLISDWGSSAPLQPGAPQLINCEFTENGRAIHINVGRDNPAPRIVHCTVAFNDVGFYGSTYRALPVTNSIFWGNQQTYRVFGSDIPPAFRHSIVQGGTSENGNLAENPRFLSGPRYDDRGTEDPEDDIRLPGDYRVDPTSPAIDGGENTETEIDIAGNPRPCGDAPDIGAHEWCHTGPVFFRRGETNGDDRIDMSDAILTLQWLFTGGREPTCLDAADADDSGGIELTDSIVVLNWLFLGGVEPPSPFEECGLDPTADEISCRIDFACATP